MPTIQGNLLLQQDVLMRDIDVKFKSDHLYKQTDQVQKDSVRQK